MRTKSSLRIAPQESAKDVVVEVLVEGEANHAWSSAKSNPGRQEAGPHALRVKASFVFAANGVSPLLPLIQISGDLSLMSKQIPEYRIDCPPARDRDISR